MPTEQEFYDFCSREDPKPYRKGKNGKYQCPCCEWFTLGSVGGYDICPVCFWEDDGTTGEHGFNPNGIPLSEAKKNYKTFGANDEHGKQFVRPPKSELGETEF
jgi:hypothetical protein